MSYPVILKSAAPLTPSAPSPDLLERLREYRSREQWTKSYNESLPFIGPDATSDPERWRILEEHGLACYYLGKIDEARSAFDRALEFEMSDEDTERLLVNLGYCPEPEQHWFSWKIYIRGLLVAALGYMLIQLQTCSVHR